MELKKIDPLDFLFWKQKEVSTRNMRRRQRKSRPHRNYRKITQKGGFLNRYDFAYADRDTVNQVGKIAPGLIKNASNEINNVAQQRIKNQIISQEGKEV